MTSDNQQSKDDISNLPAGKNESGNEKRSLLTRRNLLASGASGVALTADAIAIGAKRALNDPKVKNRLEILKKAEAEALDAIFQTDNAELQKDVMAKRPYVFKRFREMAETAGFPDMPLRVSEAPEINAHSFKATMDLGLLFDNKRVTIMKSLLDILNDREVVAVLGHELGHHMHRGKYNALEFSLSMVPPTAGGFTVSSILTGSSTQEQPNGEKPKQFSRRKLIESAAGGAIAAETAKFITDSMDVKKLIDHLKEFQADDESVNLSGDKEAFISAMRKLEKTRLTVYDGSGSHPTHQKRIDRQNGR